MHSLTKVSYQDFRTSLSELRKNFPVRCQCQGNITTHIVNGYVIAEAESNRDNPFASTTFRVDPRLLGHLSA